jgi:hypothetical protein
MALEDVRLVGVEQNGEKSPYYYRSRILSIATDKGTFSTPARVTTRSEYAARSGVPLSRTVPLQLGVNFRELSTSQVSGLMNERNSAEKMLGITKQFYDITRRAALKISVFQPSSSTLEQMSPAEKVRFADEQADFLQLRLGQDIITFPFLNLPISDYKEFINSRYGKDNDISTIFMLDMRIDRHQLKEILDFLILKEQPMIIGLIYREWEKTIPQHALITSYFDNERVAFFACQVSREEPESHSSNLHSIAFGGGFDLVSLMQVRGYSNNQKLDLNKIRFLNPENLGIANIETST